MVAEDQTSPVAPGRPKQGRVDRRRERTRRVLLDAAEETFWRHGFEGARIEQIAELADVSVGSIYTHFADKHDLHLAVVERALDAFSGIFSDETHLADLGPLERVLAGGDQYLRFHLDHPGAFQLLLMRTDPDTSGSEPEQRIALRVRELLDIFAQRIRVGIDAGEIRPVDPERLTRFLWGAWNGVISLRGQPAGLAPDDEEIGEILEVGRWLLREAVAAPALRDENGEVNDRLPLPTLPTSTS